MANPAENNVKNESPAQENKMGVMPVGKLLFTMSLPIMISMLVQALYNVVDSMFVARVSENALTALSMAFPIQNLMIAVSAGLGVGLNAVLSRALGAKDEKGVNRAATNGIMLLFICGLVFMLGGATIVRPYFEMQTDIAEIVESGVDYTTIVMLGSMGIFMQILFERLLQSTGRVMIPFVGSLISVAVNIVLNALLIFGLCGFPALGVQGAAIASLVSAVVGALVIYGAGIAKKTLLRTGRSGLVGITGGFIRDFARVSMPAMLNESAWALGNLLYSSVYGHMGTGAYASITVVKSIEDLTSVAVMGLCSSCAVMIGSAIGRGDVPLSKLCAKRHVQLTIGLSVLIGAGMLALRQPLLSLFGVSQAVRDDALAVLAICALEMVLHNIPAILVMGVFRAGGDTRFGLIVDCITLYLIGLPLTMLAGLYLHWSVPMTYLVMYLSEDIIKCSAYLLHFRSYKWIRPVI